MIGMTSIEEISESNKRVDEIKCQHLNTKQLTAKGQSKSGKIEAGTKAAARGSLWQDLA
jgi:hypothetical protein